MIIVTGPYTSPDPEVKKQRVKALSNACLTLMQRGDIAVSPLIFGLALIEQTGKQLPDTYEFWDKFCREFVGVSTSMYILNLEGWELSNGTRDEMKEATKRGIPIYLVNPETLEIIKPI